MTTSIRFECALIIYFSDHLHMLAALFCSPSISFCDSRSDSLSAKRHIQLLKSAFTWGYKHTPLLPSFLSLNNTHSICFGFVYCRPLFCCCCYSLLLLLFCWVNNSLNDTGSQAAILRKFNG